jgi:hypothetical protein
VKTPDYVQVTGVGDFTKINIPRGDAGGELDPHGADGNGNPSKSSLTYDLTPGYLTGLLSWWIGIWEQLRQRTPIPRVDLFHLRYRVLLQSLYWTQRS